MNFSCLFMHFRFNGFNGRLDLFAFLWKFVVAFIMQIHSFSSLTFGEPDVNHTITNMVLWMVASLEA